MMALKFCSDDINKNLPGMQAYADWSNLWHKKSNLSLSPSLKKKKEIIYPKRLIRDEGKVSGGRLLPDPFPRDAGATQELAVGEAGSEFQGHVVEGLLLLRGTAAGQTHVEAEVGEEAEE